MVLEDRAAHIWEPISDLPENWSSLANLELPGLAKAWREQSGQLRETDTYKEFVQRLQREAAIETGVIERLYAIDRGITRVLIEQGIYATLIPHQATDQPVNSVVNMIKDQEQAIEGLFDFVKQQRTLSLSYIKELHQVLTAHQDAVEAVDSFDRRVRVRLERGTWKTLPNSVTRPDGWRHEYCPPEQVQSEMDRLVEWHKRHCELNIPEEIESAWLHHRFTQIHPFQDGNGRVARCLATLIFLKAGLFPLVIARDDVGDYIKALENADNGNLNELVNLFARKQKLAIMRALSLSEDVLKAKATQRTILQQATAVLKRHKKERDDLLEQSARQLLGLTIQKIKDTTDEINKEISNIDQKYAAWETYALPGDPNIDSYRYQIEAGANMMGYYANRSIYKSWAALNIQTDTKTEILISFHGIGRSTQHLLVASALGFRLETVDNNHNVLVDSLQPLCNEPFAFGVSESMAEVEQRFRQWLEQAIVAGLAYWQRSL